MTMKSQELQIPPPAWGTVGKVAPLGGGLPMVESYYYLYTRTCVVLEQFYLFYLTVL